MARDILTPPTEGVPLAYTAMLDSLKRNRRALDMIDPSRAFHYMQIMDAMRQDMDAAIALATAAQKFAQP